MCIPNVIQMMLVSFIKPDADFPGSIPGIQSTLVVVNIFTQSLWDTPHPNNGRHLHKKNRYIFILVIQPINCIIFKGFDIMFKCDFFIYTALF